MDPPPNCAICNAPAYPECPCESERLSLAVQQAEKRAMDTKLAEIREWVIDHARTQILHAFTAIARNRKAVHQARLSSLPYYDVYVQYAGHPPIHPAALAQLQAAISNAHAELKRGIDADWRASVTRYPEVLDYFYSLVDWRTPGERASSVVEPPFAMPGAGGGLGAGAYGGYERRKKRNSRDRDMSAPPPDKHAHRRSMSFQVAGRPKAPPMAPMPPGPPPPYSAKGGYFRY